MKTRIENQNCPRLSTWNHPPSSAKPDAPMAGHHDQSPANWKVGAAGQPERRSFAPFLRASALFLLVVFWQTAALQAQDFEYSISNGQVTVTGYIGSSGDVTIPESIEDLPVTAIGDYAFLGHTGLVSVTIPNGVTHIGDWTFSNCTSLTSVTIGNSVISIGAWAFSVCTSLASIMVDAENPSYSSVDGVLFNKDRTTLIRCPGGKAGEYVVPNSVTGIGNSAFSWCMSLVSVSIGNSVTIIGDRAFSGCTSLASVTIPNSVIHIGYAAFDRCTSLTSATIPSSVTIIGGTNAPIPFMYPGPRGGAAFSSCTSLVSIIVDAGNPNYSSLDGVLFDKDRTALIQCPGGKAGEYAVPNSVKFIAVQAFSGCINLTSVTIPSSVTLIDQEAFSDCTSLRSVYFAGNGLAPSFVSFNDRVTVYYRAGTTGWSATFEGRPAVLWIPEEDLDHDGMTNLEELLAGTDPSDATSILAFEREARPEELSEEDKTAIAPSQFALYFQSIPGKSYDIEFSETLGGGWTKVAALAAGRATQRRVALDRTATTGFYRIGLRATP